MRNLKLALIILSTLALVTACAKQEAATTTAAAPKASVEAATPAPDAPDTAASATAEPEGVQPPEVAETPVAEPAPAAATSTRPAPMLPRRGEVASMEAPEPPKSDAAKSQRVTIQDAYEILQAGNGVLVDVRNADAFQYQNIPGAISMPLGEVASRASELPQDKWIITYCTCPAEESSGAAATTLSNMGFERVAALLGGMQGWRAANLPIQFGQQ